MKKVISTIGISSVIYALPVLVLAQQTFDSGAALSGYTNTFITFINGTLVPLIFAVAFIVFLYGVFKTFILGGGDETKREEGRQLMLYAVIGFLLMVSIWGIVNLLANGFGLRQNDIGNLPETPGSIR